MMTPAVALAMSAFCSGCEGERGAKTTPARVEPVGPQTTVTADIAAPLEAVFAYAVAEDVLPRVLKRYGPVPAIIGTVPLHGPWERVGADRRVLIDGGGTLHEQITHFERPGYFGYQIDDFQGTALKLLAKRAVGSWVFTRVGGSTHIEWTYSFEPSAAVATPLTWFFLKTFYRGYMRQALDLMREALEVNRPAAAPPL